MDKKRAATAEDQAVSGVLYDGGRAVTEVVELGGTLSTSPASGLDLEDGDDRALYYALVLEHAHHRALDAGRLFDVYDADPDRMAEFLGNRDWIPLDEEQEGWEAHLEIQGSRSVLRGYICLLGSDESIRPRSYQAVLGDSKEASCITLPERRSWVGEMPLRVAPLRTVLLIGLDETNLELARGLRRLGLRVLLAQPAGAERREVLLDLRDQGFPVFEIEEPVALSEALRSYGGVDLVVEGHSSDTVLTPEGSVQKGSELDAAGEALVEASGTADVLTFDDASAEFLGVAGPSVLPLPEAACLEVLLPLLDGADIRPGGVEASFDLTLPTTIPFGEKNRHSTDDVNFKVARGLERRILDVLEKLNPDLPLRFKAVENPATGRSRAVAVRQQLGPWTVHLAGVATIRAPKSEGGYLQADEYERLLKTGGDVRVLPAPASAEDSVQFLLDGTYLQNIVFSKLGSIHSYRPAAVVVPLTDESFQVFFLTPQLSYGVVGRIRGALAVSGLAGDEREGIRRLADAALDLPRLDARIACSYPDGAGLPSMESRPLLPAAKGHDPIVSLMNAAGGFESLPSAETSLVEMREDDEGHTLYTGPGAGLDMNEPRDRALYLSALLDYLHRVVTESGRIVCVHDREGEEIKRLLSARMMEFTPDPDMPGRATAPIRIGHLKGTRYRLGSERVPGRDRLVQVDLFRSDDGSDAPRSITVAPGSGVDDPIVAMPTTVQIVFGFGNICGDLGVLERRLAYRVVAFNRSPNERALNALENGVPLYEFDEMLDEKGNLIVHGDQRKAFELVGLRLGGRLRDLMDGGIVVGETDQGIPVRARVGHILDGLLGSVDHPVLGKHVKASELYKEILFDHYEGRGIPTIYNGSNSPERVAEGRIFIHDAFMTYGIEPVEHYEEWDGPHGSLMCVSCNTTNITGVLLRLTGVPGMSDVKIRVMTHRKANDQYVGEGKQSVNYQGMAFDFHYHHWADAKLFYDRIKDEGVRRRLDATFARDHDGGEPEWAISTHATGQAATEFHTGVIHLGGKLGNEPLDARKLKAELTASASESAQLIEFPNDEVDARALLKTLHLRLGIRNLYVQPFTIVQDGDDVTIVFFTPHLYNVKPNNLVAALNRDGLIPNTLSGVRTGTGIVSDALGLDRQQNALARYYGLSVSRP